MEGKKFAVDVHAGLLKSCFLCLPALEQRVSHSDNARVMLLIDVESLHEVCNHIYICISFFYNSSPISYKGAAASWRCPWFTRRQCALDPSSHSHTTCTGNMIRGITPP